MIEIKKEFSKTELLWFGPLFALFVGIIASILVRRFHWNTAALILCGLAAALIVVYYVAPSLQTRIYRGWMLSVAPIGYVVSHLLLALVYYFVLTPIGLALRVFGYDPMLRKLDPAASTYWVARTQPTDSKQYFRQF